MQVNDDMVRAAAEVFCENGIHIALPQDGDLDDLERERYDTLRVALNAALAHMWRPVGEAETNTHVIVFCPDAAEHTQTMICARLEFEGDPNEPEWFELNCECRPNPIDVEPTHFMPLPAPPKTGGE